MIAATKPWAGPPVTVTGREPTAPDWRDHAACRGMPTDLFYVPDGVRGRRKDLHEEQAKQVCAACPVARQCRQAAQQQPERWGVWGGLTDGERGWRRR